MFTKKRNNVFMFWCQHGLFVGMGKDAHVYILVFMCVFSSLCQSAKEIF